MDKVDIQKRIKILFIPAFSCHDKVAHAGGQVCNNYLSKFYNDNNFEVGFAVRAKDTDVDYIAMKEKYKLAKDFSMIIKSNSIKRYYYSLITRFYRYFYFNPKLLITSVSYRDFVNKTVKKIKRLWYPDVVILDWTQINIWAEIVRKVFANSKIVSFEQDVSFLGIKRRYPTNLKIQEKFKLEEIKALKVVDLVITLNEKDKLALLPYINEDKIKVVHPYYHAYGKEDQNFDKRNGILFFGAMGRSENIEAVEYFLKEVFPFIRNKSQIVFYCVGGGVKEFLINKYKADSIKFTGYVEDPSEYFDKSFCMVVPLFHGAGIKVKVLEGMASGLPVITNDIGIEGIPALNKYHYIHCNSSEEYINAIDELFANKEKCKFYSKNAIEFIKENFDLNKSYLEYKEAIINLFLSKEEK